MRRIFFVVDLALLRGPDRETRLQNLISSLARAWAIYYKPDISFGYKIYDSSCGDCALTHYLQKIASKLQLPKRLHTASSTDLSSADFAFLISLIDKATDDVYLQNHNLKLRRTSRAAEIPAQGLIRTLQAAVSDSYLQKLAIDGHADSSSEGSLAEGLVIACTSAITGNVDARSFVGVNEFTAAGSLSEAFSKQLPAKLCSAASTLNVKFCWLSTDDSSAADTIEEAMQPLAEVLQQKLFKNSCVHPLAAAADPPLTSSEFAALLSLQYEPEVGSEAISDAVEEFWPSEDVDIEGLKALVNNLELANPARVSTGKKLKKKGGKKEPVQPQGGSGVVGRNGRGLKLKAKAEALKQRTTSSAGGAQRGGSIPPVDAPVPPSAAPLTIEEAITKISTGVDKIIDQIFDQAGAQKHPEASTAGPYAAESIKKLVSSAFAGVVASEANSDDGMDVGDIRIAFGARAVVPAAELKQQLASRQISLDDKALFSWKCAAQVFLRLSIAIYDKTVPLSPHTLQEIEFFMHVVVTSMPPIMKAIRSLHDEAIKPHFSSLLPADRKKIERIVFADEEEDEVDSDGGFAAFKDRQAVIEAIGETPERPGNKVAVADEDDTARDAPQPPAAAAGQKQKINNKPSSRGVLLQRAGHSQQGGGGGSQSFRSGEGSGIFGSASAATGGATAATRKTGALPDAEFLSRRYANSKQYSMQLRVAAPQNNAKKSQNRPSGLGKKLNNDTGADSRSHRSNKRPNSPTRHHQKRYVGVPDTPQDGKKAKNAGNAGVVAPKQLFSPVKTDGPAPVLEAIPNTTPRETRAMARTTGNRDDVEPIRQPLFGAVIPTNQQQERDFVGQQQQQQDNAGKPVQPSWFAHAVVPKGNVRSQPAAPVVAIPQQQQLPAEEEKEEEQAPAPRSTGIRTRCRSNVAAAAAVEEPAAAKKAPVSIRKSNRKAAHEAIGEQQEGEKADIDPPAPAVTAAAGTTTRRQAAAAALAEQQPTQPSTRHTRKRARDAEQTVTAIDEKPAVGEEQPQPAPSKRRQSTRIQNSKAAAAPTATMTTRRGAKKKDAGKDAEVNSPPAPALDFQDIMAADVVVENPAELGAAAEVESPSPPVAMPPPLPVLAPEAVAPQQLPFVSPAAAAKMVTPMTAPAPTPSVARTASVLGKKRTLVGLTGRTPATKRGRINSMLATGTRPKPRLTAVPTKTTPSPVVEDLGSPAKPSPYGDEFALAASPGGGRKKKGVRAAAGGNKGKGGKKPNGGVKKNMAAALNAVAEPADSSGESIGDAPAPRAAKPLFGGLKSLSPINNGSAEDSDAEDEAVLQAAANGKLSPPQAAGVNPTDKQAATASVLQTTPLEDQAEVASTPQSRRRGAKSRNNKKSGADLRAKQQLHMSKLAANQEKASGVIAGVPTIGDDIMYYLNLGVVQQTLHMKIASVLSTTKDLNGGWECKVEAQPVVEEGNADSMVFVLKSANLKPWDSVLQAAAEWSHLQAVDTSPVMTHGGAALPPAETVRHNQATKMRLQERDSLDSTPVLPATAEKLRQSARTGIDKPKRPIHLDMEAMARKHIGVIPTTTTTTTAAAGGGGGAGGFTMGSRRDSLSSGGSLGLRLTGGPSPMAQQLAMAMMGSLYPLKTTPQPPESVEKHLAAALSPERRWPRGLSGIL